jgi:hypothetical protein
LKFPVFLAAWRACADFSANNMRCHSTLCHACVRLLGYYPAGLAASVRRSSRWTTASGPPGECLRRSLHLSTACMNVDDSGTAQHLHRTCKPLPEYDPDGCCCRTLTHANHQLACMYSQTAFIMCLLCVYYAFIMCSSRPVVTLHLKYPRRHACAL